jgi:hypothetical protein
LYIQDYSLNSFSQPALFLQTVDDNICIHYCHRSYWLIMVDVLMYRILTSFLLVPGMFWFSVDNCVDVCIVCCQFSISDILTYCRWIRRRFWSFWCKICCDCIYVRYVGWYIIASVVVATTLITHTVVSFVVYFWFQIFIQIKSVSIMVAVWICSGC